MKIEIEALAMNQTWEIIETTPSARPIGCKWVYNQDHLDAW